MGSPIKGVTPALGGSAQDFITLLRLAGNFQLTHCFFLGFSNAYFQILVDWG